MPGGRAVQALPQLEVFDGAGLPSPVSRFLVKGQEVLYALGDKIFIKKGPYIINIPPGVPHSFQNLDDEVAELVVIFPTNVWEYDVLDFFPFSTPEAKAMAEEARRARAQSQSK